MGATTAILQGLQTVNTFASQQQQAGAITSQAAFSAKLAGLQAQDVIAQGNTAANQKLDDARRTVGAQRAGLAASGIDANTGTAADIQADTASFGALDAQQIRLNATREAWGLTTQASLDQMGANNDAANLKRQSYNTLLTGASNAYGLYANRDKNTTDNSLGLTTSQQKAVSGYRRSGV